MRLITILLLITTNCFGANWYISSSTGLDSNPGTLSQPWASLAKVNSSFTSINAGDSILFKCGDSFYGSLIMGKSGTSGNPIVVSSYGTGAKPEFHGRQNLTAWTHMGGNIWRANVIGDSTLSLFTVNGTIIPFKSDSAGWKKYTLGIDSNRIVYPHNGSWVDSTIVIKCNEWRIERVVVTRDVNDTITFRNWFEMNNGTVARLEPLKPGYGFFLFNNLSYLKAQNDLYYDYDNQFAYLYSNGIPTNVVTTRVDTGINIGTRSYIHVKNISFKYFGLFGIYAIQTQGLNIDGCSFSYMGAQGFGCYRLYNSTIQNSTFTNCLQMGIYVRSVSTPYSNISILNDTFSTIGLWYGMGSYNEEGDYSAMGVSAFTGLTVTGNWIDNIGDIGVKWGGNDVLIANNSISNYSLKACDRGAIYTFSDITGTSTTYNRLIRNNFCSNAWGDLNGTPQEKSTNPVIRAIGIYLDGRNEGDTIRNNVVWNIPGGATSLNIDSNVVVHSNLFVLTDSITRYQRALGTRVQMLRNYPVRFFNFTNNIVFTTLSTQKQFQYTAASQSPASIIPNFKLIGAINGNFYNLPTVANYQTESGTPYGLGNYTHSQYVSTFGYGVNDVQLPNYTLKECLFLRNQTNAVSVKTFTGTYEDAYGVQYTNSITMQPYTGVLLFPSTAPPPPPTQTIRVRIKL